MPEILPFRAFTYASSLRSELSRLLSPPYDVLSADAFKKMAASHRFQSVKLGLAENPEDPERYKKMASLFREWKTTGVLSQATKPSLYLIEEIFEEAGEKHLRLGFIALLKLSPYEEKKVLPHEHTLSGPKKDRFDLLHTMKAEISQIFLGYNDSADLVGKIYAALKKEKALLEGVDSAGVARRVWAIDDNATISRITEMLRTKPVLIADGHHRYETALASRDLCPYAACYFTNLDQPGFSIRPIHRIFSLPPSLTSERFLESIRSTFSVEKIPENLASKIPDQKLLEVWKVIQPQKLHFIVTIDGAHFHLSRVRTENDAEIFSIHRDIFEAILKWNIQDLKKGTISYANTTDEYRDAVSDREKVGLFLPPTDLSLVMQLAQRGERMPQKSTFFYPKIASGLIIFDLESY